MTTTIGVVVMALAILASVTLHEYGHYKTAKFFGMKVTQFFVGFGPTLWSRHKGETEYGVKAIPAGGFVRIVGQTSLEELDPADEPRAMYRQPLMRRAIVMSAGSAMHFLIGFVLIYGVLVTAGQYKITTTLSEVAPCLEAKCTAASTPSPARAAGLLRGDKIVTVDGMTVKNWDMVTTAIRSHHAGEVISLGIVRAGEPLTLTPAVASVQRASASNPKVLVSVGVIGISPKEIRAALNPLAGVTRAGDFFWQSSKGTVHAIGQIPSQIPKLFQSRQKTQNDSGRLITVVGAARLGGDAVRAGGFSDFLILVASLNISIGIFNLLPLLPLDGGHLAVMFYERARSSFARRVHRPDPGRVDMLKLLPATYLFLAFFGTLSLVMVFNDLVNPIASPF